MSKEEISLAKVDETTIASYVTDGTPMGLEEYKPASEWGYLKLDQKTGDIEYTLTGERQKTWEIVIIDYSFSRILFPSGMAATDPICKTIEQGKNPNNLEGTKFGNCVSCEHSQWVDNKPPACKMSLNFSGFVGGTVAMPFSVPMRGASYKVGENLLNTYFRAKRPLFSSILTIGTIPRTRGGVDYFEYTIAEARAATPQEMETFASIHIQGMGSQRPEVSSEPVTAEKAAEILGGEIVEDDKPPF